MFEVVRIIGELHIEEHDMIIGSSWHGSYQHIGLMFPDYLLKNT